MPNLTVLMTTYNEEKEIFLKSLESIQNQTYEDFNILIIVDNKDNVDIIEVLKRKSKEDKRIQYMINKKNIGLALSLNKGIDLINTKYIARMDADDIADSNRLYKQYLALKNNDKIDLVGTNIYYIDYNGNKLYPRSNLPENSKNIRVALKYVNVMNHPTFFGKTEVFKRYKYRNLKYSQDYDFTCRLAENGCNLSNINEPLLLYRNPEKLNDNKKMLQTIVSYCIRKQYNRKKLTSSDIEKIIDLEIKNANSKKVIKSIDYYEETIKNLKSHNYIFATIFFAKSILYSKYKRIELLNLIMYFFIKKRVNRNKK